MVQLIVGEKGKGKTKELLDRVNKEIKEAKEKKEKEEAKKYEK